VGAVKEAIGFAWVPLLVALLLAARPAGAEPRACLSPGVGDAISRALSGHRLDDALPAGWSISDVDVEREQIDVIVVDDHGGRRQVLLRPREAVEHADGQGPYFDYTVVDRDGGAGADTLLRLAASVEAVVPVAELGGCRPPSTSPSPSPSAQPSSTSWSDARDRWLERGAPVPRWLALSVGVLEVVAVGLALGFARARRPRWGGSGVLARGATFALSLAIVRGAAGAAPALWLDTINDQRDARACLVGRGCTSLGEGTSVRGLHHAVGWLDFTAVCDGLGVSLGALHGLMLILAALAVTVVADMGARPAGRLGAAVAAIATIDLVFAFVNLHALYNTSILPFLGAVFLASCLELARRPGRVSVVLAAVVGGLLASVHAACILAGASVLWIAALSPRRRAELVALAALAFVAVTLGVGPGSWLSNAHHVVGLLGGSPSGPAPHATWPARLLGFYTWASAATIVSYVLARRSARGGVRTAIMVSSAVVLPMLAASAAAAATSAAPTNAKYLAHVAPAVALWLVGVVSWIARRGLRSPRKRRVALGVLAAVMGTMMVADMVVSSMNDPVTFDETRGVLQELAARGWTYGRAYRDLRTRDGVAVLASVDLLGVDLPAAPAGEDRTCAYVVKTAPDRVPSPLPPGWVVTSRSRSSATLIAFVPSGLAWDDFEVCDGRAATCQRGGLRRDAPAGGEGAPGMPSPGGELPFTLTLKLAAIGSPGEREEVVMPAGNVWNLRGAMVCGGRVVSLPAAGEITEGGRRATWVAGEDGGSLELQWDVGSSECSPYSYQGLPPFLIEGSPRSVEAIDALER
jgi:hypothetical protein